MYLLPNSVNLLSFCCFIGFAGGGSVDNPADFAKYLVFWNLFKLLIVLRLLLCPKAYLSFVQAYQLDITFTMVSPYLVILSPS